MSDDCQLDLSGSETRAPYDRASSSSPAVPNWIRLPSRAVSSLASPLSASAWISARVVGLRLGGRYSRACTRVGSAGGSAGPGWGMHHWQVELTLARATSQPDLAVLGSLSCLVVIDCRLAESEMPIGSPLARSDSSAELRPGSGP